MSPFGQGPVVALDARIVTLVDALLMLAAWRVGYRLSRRRLPDERVRMAKHASSLAQWCLGVFGLLQAFAFGTVYAKYESRRVDVVLEANAIGTFAMRVEVFPAQVRAPVLQSLGLYVALQRQAAEGGRTREERRSLDGRQKPAAFNLDRVMESLTEGGISAH